MLFFRYLLMHDCGWVCLRGPMGRVKGVGLT